MLKQYDFLLEKGFRGVSALPSDARDIIEGIVDLWVNLEGSIPRDRNMFHELFSKYPDKWFDYLKTVRPDLSSLIRGWWLENARIRNNTPERYLKRHIRRDWYGYAEDPIPYSGKIFILPIPPVLGLKLQTAKEYSDRFAKILWEMVGDDVFNYDVLHLWPKEEEGVRDIDIRRTKACRAVIIATEKMIGEPKLKEFASVYGVAVLTSVGGKPSALSDWAVVSEFVAQMKRRDVPILLVTLADYDYDGITGTHLAFKDHFEHFYPEVEHLMCGVFPHQIPTERLTPGDALYEPTPGVITDWLRAVEKGTLPPDMAPYEYEGKYYGIEMDTAGMGAFLPTIVKKLEELGCTQDSWTDWARDVTFPDVDEVERGEISSFAGELPEHKQLVAVRSQVSKERWRTVEEYDKLSGALMGLESRVEDKAREELEGIADDIIYEEGFDDRGRPEPSTLTERVAIPPLKPYEEYWDEETKTGFSRDYLERKLREELRDRYDEKLDDVQARVEELEGEIHRRKEEALDLLNEVRTPSRVRE